MWSDSLQLDAYVEDSGEGIALHQVTEAKKVFAATGDGEGATGVTAHEEVTPALALPYSSGIAQQTAEGVGIAYDGVVLMGHAEGHGELTIGVAVVVAHLYAVAVAREGVVERWDKEKGIAPYPLTGGHGAIAMVLLFGGEATAGEQDHPHQNDYRKGYTATVRLHLVSWFAAGAAPRYAGRGARCYAASSPVACLLWVAGVFLVHR